MLASTRGGNDGGEGKWWDSRHVLKFELTGFADRLDVESLWINSRISVAFSWNEKIAKVQT